MKFNVKSLIEQVVKEEVSKLKALKEYSSMEDEDTANYIADEFGTPEVEAILSKWDCLGYEDEAEAMAHILHDKNWKNTYDLSGEDSTDLNKITAWVNTTKAKMKQSKSGNVNEAPKPFKVNPKYNVLSEAKVDPSEDKKVNSLVKLANTLIEKGIDKDGDSLSINPDTSSTWEEEYTYKPIVKQGNKITITSNSPYSNGGKDDVDVMVLGKDYFDDIEASLKNIIKGFKKAYKKAGVALPGAANLKPEDTVNETTIITTQDGTLATATPDQKTQAQKASATGDDVKISKTGAPLAEKKEEKEAPVEDAPIEDAPAEDSTGSLSSELDKHISSAIDAAAKCVQETGDKKYEKVLGKVIKNLTAAQSSLEAVKAHETELSEQAAVEDEKSTANYIKTLRKILKGTFKNPEHIEQVIKKFAPVIRKSKDKDPQKVAEAITKYALQESKK